MQYPLKKQFAFCQQFSKKYSSWTLSVVAYVLRQVPVSTCTYTHSGNSWLIQLCSTIQNNPFQNLYHHPVNHTLRNTDTCTVIPWCRLTFYTKFRQDCWKWHFVHVRSDGVIQHVHIHVHVSLYPKNHEPSYEPCITICLKQWHDRKCWEGIYFGKNPFISDH